MGRVVLSAEITGQKGGYLSEVVLEQDIALHYIKRRAASCNSERIDHLYKGPHESTQSFTLRYGDLTATVSLARIIGLVRLDEIHEGSTA